MQEATCCSPSLCGSPRERLSEGHGESCWGREQVRWFPAPCAPSSASAGAHEQQARPPHPCQDHLRFPSSYGSVEWTKSAKNPVQNRPTTLACFPQLALTGPTRFVPGSACTKCLLLALRPGWQVGGNLTFFTSRTCILLQAKPILSYNSTVFTPSLVQHQSRPVVVNRNLHSWNTPKHSVLVEVTIAHLSHPFFSPLPKQPRTQRHLYSCSSLGSLFSQGVDTQIQPSDAAFSSRKALDTLVVDVFKLASSS